MRLAFPCPVCEQTARMDVDGEVKAVTCPFCGWDREIPAGQFDEATDRPAGCLACGCRDLWRQKDFPPQLGLTIVGVGALISTILWYLYLPMWAIGVLMLFALGDLAAFALMKDVLVCYRCGARHRPSQVDASHERFNLETFERYRQEQQRLAERKANEFTRNEPP